jgi:sirohydrochlorin cobaltochelatase
MAEHLSQYYESRHHSDKNYYDQYLFFIQCGRCIRIRIVWPYQENTQKTAFEVTYMAKGMLLVGHGSTMPYNQELVEKTAEFIKAKNAGYIVKCGFMNMNKPTIRESLEAFRHEPIEALVVVPLFLAKGVHIEKDIPGEIGLAEGVKRGSLALNGKSIPLVYADPIGSDPLLAELMVRNADKALSLL